MNDFYANRSDTFLKHQLDNLYYANEISQSVGLCVQGSSNNSELEKLDAELEALLFDEKEIETPLFTPEITFKADSPAKAITDLNIRYMEGAKLAEDLEIKIFSDIHNYEFDMLVSRIRTVIDFIELDFSTVEMVSYSQIKKYLTEKTKKKFYIEGIDRADSSKQRNFMIRVHDVESLKDLKPILLGLSYYGVTEHSVKVYRIETAIDFYGKNSKALLIALYKSIAYEEGSNNERIYKFNIDHVPTVPGSLLIKIMEGYCIGVNPKGADTYYRLYYKESDCGQQLANSQRRCRSEVNCAVSSLDVDRSIENLSKIIQASFKKITFTKMGNKATAFDLENYRNQVQRFGTKSKKHFAKSRRVRHFENTAIVTHTQLNFIIRSKVRILANKFKADAIKKCLK